MASLSESLGALDVRGRVVVEVARICEPDGYLHAIQLVFIDGWSLTLTVWTDWRLVADLRSQAVMPVYPWPPEAMTRSVIDRMTGVVSKVVPSRNEAGELVRARFAIGSGWLVVGSFAGDLTIGSSPGDDGGY